LFNLLQGCYYIINVIIVIAGGYITKAISDFFKEIFLVFSIVLGKGSSIFLEFNIELIK
jgi:hypothetical protein